MTVDERNAMKKNPSPLAYPFFAVLAFAAKGKPKRKRKK
jgi:hypothetical protein